MTNQERQLNEDFSFLLSQMTDERKKKILCYISYYEIGKRNPDINGLRRLSKFFNVSADYLLGLSDAQTNDKDLQARLFSVVYAALYMFAENGVNA